MFPGPAILPRISALLVLLALFPPSLSAGGPQSEQSFLNRPVFEVIEYFRSQGYPFAYSTNLVPDSLKVSVEPISTDPFDVVLEILEPLGLTLKQSDGIYLVIRSARDPPENKSGTVLIIIRNQASNLLNTPVVISGNPGLRAVEELGNGVLQIKQLDAGSYDLNLTANGYLPARRMVTLSAGDTITLNVKMDPQLAELEALSVSTSRYVLFSNSQFFVDQRAIQNLPGNGDDPLRSLHRLPGAAAGGWSSMTHFRGGEENESAIFLNGLQLLDPFHIRDFHNAFSSIDARSISGVEAYTGGFPVNYGDRMSGLLLLQSQKPEKPRKYELGISMFNTSVLTSGYIESGKMDWLLSARRSNLDLILDSKEHGEPTYHDIFATLGFNISADTRLTINALIANDRILAITEHLEGDREQSTSDTKNQHFWIQLDHSFSPDFSGSLVASDSSFSNTRIGLIRDTEELIADVFDDREADIQGLRADFSWYVTDKHLLTYGVEFRKETARYQYQSEAEYDGFYLAYPGVPESLERNVTASPSGERYSAYISDRWQINPDLIVDAGLRWDKQTYLGPVPDDQVSPRLNFLYNLSPDLDLRLTWGRYHQSQEIQQLQVEDGVDRFFRAQQADHLIAGVSYRFSNEWTLRAEMFEKNYSNLRPRFENLLDPIPLIFELEPDRVRIAPESGLSRGTEFTLQYDNHNNLNGWVSYTLSRVTDEIDGMDQLRNWDQRHSIQAGLAWQKGVWEFGFAAKYHSGWPSTPATLIRDEDEELELVYGTRNSTNLDSFINFDMRVSRTWQLEKTRFSAFFEISNAFDRRNQCCVDYDAEDEGEDLPPLERSVDNWLGASPAVGVLWEF